MVKTIKFLFIVLGLFLSAGVVQAQEGVNFPIEELGNCGSKEECREYCNVEENKKSCLEFGRRKGLIKEEDAEKARKIVEKPGPGGCRGDECRTFCEAKENHKTCLEFALENGLLSEEEARLARITLEGGPGGCQGEECKDYCEDESHFEECLKFAEERGMISREEASKARKVGVQNGPGGCRGEACRTYCEDPKNHEECINFAEANGFMTKEEVERARKFINKTGPGGCRGEECRTYCEDPVHMQDCLAFAEKEGLMPKEKLERARKFVKIANEGGPGGCRGEACRTHCEDPANQEECFRFAKEKGLVSEAEVKNFEAGQKLNKKVKEQGGPGGCKTDEECMAYCASGEHIEECIAFAAAHGGISEEEAKRMLEMFKKDKARAGGRLEDAKRFEDESRRKLEESRQNEEINDRGFKGGFSGDFSGPGGCKTPEECKKFCSENLEACRNLESNLPKGIERGRGEPIVKPEIRNDFRGPGGCNSPETCAKYCAEHAEECANFGGRVQFRPQAQPQPHNSPEFGEGRGDFSGPGGCRTEEECAKYCQTNAEECQKFEMQQRSQEEQG